jgi:membrane fusion protein, copper/silver efflux system
MNSLLRQPALMAIAATALLVGGWLGGWWWARRAQSPPVIVAAKQPEVLYWYDPMVPSQHFDKPGKSPFMDMQLVPRYAKSGEKGINTTSGVSQNLGMRLAKVERIALQSRVEASGVLGFNERDVAVVQSRAAGFVERVWPLAPGDMVKAGAPLFELRVPEWTAAEHEFLAIRSSRDALLIDAARDRLRLLGIDNYAIGNLEKNGVAQSRFTLRAPITGVVNELDLRNGMTVTAGQTLLRLNGLSTLWLEAAVPQSLAGSVTVGARAEVRFANLATPIKGRVSALLPLLSDATRTMRVRVELANRDGTLRPGQSAQVTLSTDSTATSGPAALAVPTEAVIRTGRRSFVMLAEQGRFRPVDVQLGQEIGEQTVIENGLAEGQLVVASGQFLLDSEASLRGLGK